MKCGNSAFNAQGSRVIIVVVQVGAVKIYAGAAMEALRKKERVCDQYVLIMTIPDWLLPSLFTILMHV
jgi:cell shape-determining protein MreD